jgi:hypothetical protein
MAVFVLYHLFGEVILKNLVRSLGVVTTGGEVVLLP